MVWVNLVSKHRRSSPHCKCGQRRQMVSSNFFRLFGPNPLYNKHTKNSCAILGFLIFCWSEDSLATKHLKGLRNTRFFLFFIDLSVARVLWEKTLDPCIDKKKKLCWLLAATTSFQRIMFRRRFHRMYEKCDKQDQCCGRGSSKLQYIEYYITGWGDRK